MRKTWAFPLYGLRSFNEHAPVRLMRYVVKKYLAHNDGLKQAVEWLTERQAFSHYEVRISKMSKGGHYQHIVYLVMDEESAPLFKLFHVDRFPLRRPPS